MTQISNRAEYLLQKALLTINPAILAPHPWAWEVSRWHELVVAFLMKVTGKPEAIVREMVETLIELELLEVDQLSTLSTSLDTLVSSSRGTCIALP